MPFSTPFEIGSCGSKAPTLATTSMMCGPASRSTTKPVRRSPNRTSFISFSCCEGESKRSVAFARNEKLRFLLLNWKDRSEERRVGKSVDLGDWSADVCSSDLSNKLHFVLLLRG